MLFVVSILTIKFLVFSICCMYVHLTDSSHYTILFSHGNAVDLGQMSSFYVALGTRINCNIFSYDYSGYGASNG